MESFCKILVNDNLIWGVKITYNIFITAAGNTGNFAEARDTYNNAIKWRLADAVTYASFITAAGCS